MPLAQMRRRCFEPRRGPIGEHRKPFVFGLFKRAGAVVQRFGDAGKALCALVLLPVEIGFRGASHRLRRFDKENPHPFQNPLRAVAAGAGGTVLFGHVVLRDPPPGPHSRERAFNIQLRERRGSVGGSPPSLLRYAFVAIAIVFLAGFCP